MHEDILDETIHRYIDGEVEFDAITDLCDSLAPTVENKNMLLCAIDSFDIDELYDTLFDKFEGMLTAEEKRKYWNEYMSIFTGKTDPETSKPLKLKYVGESFGVDSLTNGKIYGAVEEDGMYRVIDDSGEDYLYSMENPVPLDGSSPGVRWETVETRTVVDEFSVKKYKILVMNDRLPCTNFNYAIIDGVKYKITISYDIKNSIAIETDKPMLGKTVIFD